MDAGKRMVEDRKMTPRFIGFPVTLPIKGEGPAQDVLLYDFGFMDSVGRLHWCFRGDISDGNSIPGWAKPLVGDPFENPWPAYIHDSDYEHQQWPRDICDLAFREGLTVCQAPRWKRSVFYRAVRVGGAKPYNDMDPADVARYDLIPHEILNEPSDQYIPPEFRAALTEARAATACKWSEIELRDRLA